MPSLLDIEQQTKKFADAHTILVDIVRELNAQLELIKRQHLTAIKHAVAAAAERQDHLKTLIDGAPELFTKPRTFIFHGVKVGLTKERGGIVFDDPARVVERIKKIYGPDAASYLHVKETPDRAALDRLTVCELKKLGCEIVADSDKVVIKPTDSDVDKIVTALLADAAEQAES